MIDAEPKSLAPSDEERQLIKENRGKNPHDVALRLRKSDVVRPSFVAEQVDGWNRLAVKVPLWAEKEGLYFPFVVSLQQCSSESVARWRAQLVEGDSLLDLTGGLGVDCYFMGMVCKRVTYVDADGRAVLAAKHNYGILGANNTDFVCSRAEEYLESVRVEGQHYGTIFIDPSRRSQSGGRVFRISDCSPDVEKIAEGMLEVADTVIIKLSPLLDVSMLAAQLPKVSDVYAVGASGECKDIIVKLSNRINSIEPTLHAVSVDASGLGEDFKFTMAEEHNTTLEVSELVGGYIFEPSPQLMKIGAFKLIGERYGAKALAKSTHIYTSDEDVNDFPGRRFKVVATYENSKKGIAALKHEIDGASVAVRNFPISAEALRAKLKVKENEKVFVYGVTMADGSQKLILCNRVG